MWLLVLAACVTVKFVQPVSPARQASHGEEPTNSASSSKSTTTWQQAHNTRPTPRKGPDVKIKYNTSRSGRSAGNMTVLFDGYPLIGGGLPECSWVRMGNGTPYPNQPYAGEVGREWNWHVTWAISPRQIYQLPDNSCVGGRCY